MGGHGGLNILPQKRWNVYNFENREKVRKDEEAAAQQERQVAEEQRRRDGEVRREKLRAQALRRRLAVSGGEGTTAPLAGGDEPTGLLPAQGGAGPAEGQPATLGLDVLVGDSRVGLEAEQPARHVNLFEEEEQRTAAEAAQASSPRPQTSEGSGAWKRTKESNVAKEGDDDERYRLGYGASKPWYAVEKKPIDVPAAAPEHVAPLLQPRTREGANGPRVERDLLEPREAEKQTRTKHRKSRGEHRKKHKAHSRTRDTCKADEGDKSKLLELSRLRRERHERERAEKLRAGVLLAQNGQAATVRDGRAGHVPSGSHPVNTRGYNSGYGYGR